MNNHADKAKKIIEENIYMSVATIGENKPWISPVFFAYDSNYNLFWASNKESRHSKNIRSNPHVSIVIFSSDAPEGLGDGVYFECEAVELSEITEIQSGIEIFNSRATQADFKINDVKEVVGEGVWRIYKATPNTVSKLTEGEFVKGQYIDKRVEIKL